MLFLDGTYRNETYINLVMKCSRDLLLALPRLSTHEKLLAKMRFSFSEKQLQLVQGHTLHFINQYLRIYINNTGPLNRIVTTML